MSILIVEDEPKTAAYLQKGLTEADFEVEIADDGEKGVSRAMEENPNLIILDVMLPKKDGWTVIKELRNKNYAMPVIFLTAKDPVPDRVKGLDLGADDYLVKPFAFSELLARVRTLLRRNTSGQGDKLQVADLTIDTIRHKVWRSEQLLDLTQKEFQLLLLLISRKGEVLSRTLIIKQVWGMHFDPGTNVIDVAVRRLRSKIDDPFNPQLIHTVRGVGYVLEER